MSHVHVVPVRSISSAAESKKAQKEEGEDKWL